MAVREAAGPFSLPTGCCLKWADDGNELERIITQKWIANHMIGHEAWADVRRTGYPRLLQVVNNLSGGMWGNVDSSKGMRRLHYPQSEYLSVKMVKSS